MHPVRLVILAGLSALTTGCASPLFAANPKFALAYAWRDGAEVRSVHTFGSCPSSMKLLSENGVHVEVSCTAEGALSVKSTELPTCPEVFKPLSNVGRDSPVLASPEEMAADLKALLQNSAQRCAARAVRVI
jgi:hypothetical protein